MSDVQTSGHLVVGVQRYGKCVRTIVAIGTAALLGGVVGRWWAKSRDVAATMQTVLPAERLLQGNPKESSVAVAETQPELRWKQLSSSFDSKDPLGSATRLMPLIDALSLEDFSWLAAHPNAFLLPREKEFDRKYRGQFLNAVLERWAAVDPAGVVAKVKRLEEQMKSEGLLGWSELIEALVFVRPDLILDSREVDMNRRLQALRELAKRDVAAARRYRDGFPESDRKRVDLAIAGGLASSDPLAAAALARELNDARVFKDAVDSATRIGGDVLLQVLEKAKGDFGHELDLPSLMLRFPDIPWESLPIKIAGGRETMAIGLSDDARRLTAAEREKLLARLEQIPPGVRDNVAAALTQSWVATEPRAALDWAMTRANTDDVGHSSNEPLTWAFWEWLYRDKSAAAEWLSQLPDSKMRDALSCHAATQFVRDGETDAAQQLFEPIPGPAGAKLVENLASAQARHDPAAAAAWLDSLPSDVEGGKAAEAIVSRWFSEDPGAAAKWVESIPAGSRREYALQAYAKKAAKEDPALAAEWAVSVSDPLQRARAAETVYQELSSKDPVTARNWLRQLPGVDEHWREAILRIPF